MIKEGSQMVNVPSYQAHSSQPSVFVSEQIASFNTPFYTFVPYCPDYINYCDLDSPERNVISSQFRGCLMVIWQEDYDFQREFRLGTAMACMLSTKQTGML